MGDEDKTREQLLEELAELRQRLAVCQTARGKPCDGDPQACELDRHRLQAILTATIECLPFEFFAVGTDGRYMLQNGILREHYGDALGKRPEDYAPDELSRQVWLENNRRAFAGQRVQGEVEAHVGGEKRSYFNVIAPIRDGQELYGILGVNVDITELKRAQASLQRAHENLERWAQEELRQSHAQLRAIYDGMTDALMVIDRETARFLHVNASMSRMLGYSEEELLQLSVRQLHPPDDWPRIEPAFREHVERTGARHENIPVMRKDGTVLPIDVHSNHIVYNGRPCLLAFYHDASERIAAQRVTQALLASEQRFHVAFDEAPLGIVMTTCDGIVARVNRTFCRLTGYSEAELIGRTIAELTHPDDRHPTAALVQQMIDRQIESFSLEKRYLTRDGRFFWAQSTAALIRDNRGNPLIAQAMIEDITERRKAQEAILREQTTLKHLLQSSDHERQVIAYEIHDGLAQQLAGALMQFEACEHLRGSRPQQAAEAWQAGLTMLRKGHAEARRLISGVRPPILDEQGVVAALSHLVSEHRSRPGPEIRFTADVQCGRLAPILENAVYRIAQEALANACRHSQSPEVQVKLTQQDDQLCIEVCDQGLGFQPDEVSQSRFGLAGIHQRARLLGGTATIESQLGRGTRVVVVLPIVPRDPDEEPAAD